MAHRPEHASGAEDEAAVPDQAGAVEEQVPVVVEDGVVDLGADDAADAGGEDEGARVLLVADAEPLHPPAELEVAGEEGEDQHHARRG